MQIPDFSNTSILVAGDIMLDRYWSGPTNRISPEAPVPVIRKKQTEDRLGGAANVALNLSQLGVTTELSGLIGEDPVGQSIQALLKESRIIDASLSSISHSSITKLRLMSRNQQLLRIDTEEPIPEDLVAQVLNNTLDKLKGKAALIISDYGKGTYAEPQALISAARQSGIPTLVDPKGASYEKYRGANILTPNLNELRKVVGDCETDEEIREKADALRKQLSVDVIVVTMSERGMMIVDGSADVIRIPTRAREVFDVTGAGDTVIALLAACLGAGQTITEAAQVANLAASIVVGKLGTASVTSEELETALYAHSPSDSKTIVSEVELLALVEKAKRSGERVVMTNGCFDLLHPGHLAYIQEAASEGDRLIVAVNTDDSVQRLKGSSRPINKLADRMLMLAGIKGVDWVCSFSEDTPQRLISLILPDLLIKGGDYSPNEIAGSEDVRAAGGQIKVLDFLEGYSSSALIDHIKNT